MARAGTDDLFPSDLGRRAVPFILFGLLAYIALFAFSDAEASLHEVSRIPAVRVVYALQLVLVSFVMRAIRWEYYLRLIAVRVPLIDSMLIFLVGFAMTVTPGKFGEVVKSLLLKEAWDVPVAHSAPVLIAERVTDLLAILLLGGVGLLTVGGAEVAGWGLLAIAAGVLALCTTRKLGLWAIDLVSRIGPIGRRREKLLASYRSLTDTLRIIPLAVALLLSCVSWGMQGVAVWTIAAAFPETSLNVLEALVACCAPLLAGAIALIPGGLGATEASMTGVLMALGGEQLTMNVAVATTVLFRAVSFWFALALGFCALLVWRIRRRAAVPRQKPDEVVGTSTDKTVSAGDQSS